MKKPSSKKHIERAPSTFITSATQKEHYPDHSLKEVAVFGKSNVGKSSLLNRLLRKDLVKVSQTPGKTQLINFFNKEDKYCLVDLPGYGYAKLSKQTLESWGEMMETYLQNRDSLAGGLLLVDIRRGLDQDDKWIESALRSINRPVAYIFTKCDKVKKNEFQKLKNKFQSLYSPVFFTSSLKNLGVQEVEDFIYKTWIQ